MSINTQVINMLYATWFRGSIWERHEVYIVLKVFDTQYYKYAKLDSYATQKSIYLLKNRFNVNLLYIY